MRRILRKVWREIMRPFRRRYARSIPHRTDTSISDNQAYPQICLNACNDYRKFNKFRRNPIYNSILEHVSERDGKKYLDLILKDNEIMQGMDAFRSNDKYGSPFVFDYPGVDNISPTTLRYIKVLCDLKKHFGPLDEMNICEIGVGYGGQCRIINSMYQPSAYTLVDIRPALRLASCYLDKFVMPATLQYKTMNEISPNQYDLVISNYAFTELPREIQTVYYERIISKSAKGYITYNDISPKSFQSFCRDEIVGMLPDANIYDEDPLTHPRNCIIVWGEASE